MFANFEEKITRFLRKTKMTAFEVWNLLLISVLSIAYCSGYIFEESVLIAPNDAYVITARVNNGKIFLQAQPFPYKWNDVKSLIVDQKNNAAIISQGNKIVQISAKGGINVLVDRDIGSVTTMDFDPSLENLYWFDDHTKSVGGLSLKTFENLTMPHSHNIDGPGKMRYLLTDSMENKAFFKAFQETIRFDGELPKSAQIAYSIETNFLISSSWNGSYLIIDKAQAPERILAPKGFNRNAFMDFFYCYNYEGVGCCFI